VPDKQCKAANWSREISVEEDVTSSKLADLRCKKDPTVALVVNDQDLHQSKYAQCDQDNRKQERSSEGDRLPSPEFGLRFDLWNSLGCDFGCLLGRVPSKKAIEAIHSSTDEVSFDKDRDERDDARI
jgi:hypothetical protein